MMPPEIFDFDKKKTVLKNSASFPKNSYETEYAESMKHPERFWSKIGGLVTWFKPWKKVLDDPNDIFRKWFVEGELNACYNAVDRHVEAGLGYKTAIIYDSPVVGVVRKITYSELQDKISKLAGLLLRMGVEKGDVVIIYMPLIPETMMAMLATARIGAIHSVVFGGFAASELCTRIEHSEAKVVISASCGIEPNRIVDYLQELNDAIDMSTHKPSKCIIFQRKDVHIGELVPSRDMDWEEALKNAEHAPCIPLNANDGLYLLYTSGTTGEPKGIIRPLSVLPVLIYTLKVLYNVKPEDVWWATSDFGWEVGHSYMCYGPLTYGMTAVIYEGKPTLTPNASSYYRIIDNYRVTSMFTVPTALRVLKQADPNGKYGMEYNTSSLRQIWVAGENLDLRTKLWTENIFGVPVINHYWQTETGSPVTGVCLGLKNTYIPEDLSVGFPSPGWNVKILRKDGREADYNELGRIVLKLPLPPGMLTTLHKADERFLKTYFTRFPGYYDTMDVGFKDKNGLFYLTSRADDIINVAGHRLSTLALENIVLSHPNVSMACVVSVPDPIKNEVPLCLYVLRQDSHQTNFEVSEELVALVRENIGPIAAFKLAVAVSGLPITRSGKIMRKTIADLARNQLKKIPGTVLDQSVYEDIEKALQQLGFCNVLK